MQTAALSIHYATLSHLEPIVHFQLAMAMESEGLALDVERVKRGVRAVLEDPAKGRYLVAEKEGQLVGCLMLTREWSDWNGCWYWWIQSVFVLPEFRSQGIYRRMYETVQNLADKEEVAHLRLYVDRDNTAAQQVYQRLGMTECHYLLYEN